MISESPNRTAARRAGSPAAAMAGTIAFVALAALGAWRHEMWRDELEIWLIARDSDSLAALFTNMGTEGHPSLWYLLVWLVTRVSSAPAAMQVANVALAGTAAWIWLRRAPFSLPLRLMGAFGYFPLYEFGVISRSYALYWALLVGLCALFPLDGERPRRTLAAALLGALACHVTLYGAFVVGALGGVLVLGRLAGLRRGRPGPAPAEWGAAAVWLVGLTTAVAHVWVQYRAIGDAHLGVYHPTYDARWLADGLASLWRGLVPLPDPSSPYGWNTNLIDAFGPAAPWLGGVLGVAATAAAVWSLRRSRLALAWFLVGAAPMLALTLLFWYGQARHHGQVFVLFLAASWLAAATRPRPAPRPRPVLAVLLAAHVVAAGALLLTDVARPFSRAHAVAGLLRSAPLADATVVGSWDYAAQPIAAWLDRPIWYAESGRFGTFMIWDDRREPVSAQHVVGDARRLVRETGRPSVLVLNYELAGREVGEDVPITDGYRLRYLQRLDGAMVPDENYSLFLVYDPAALTGRTGGAATPAMP